MLADYAEASTAHYCELRDQMAILKHSLYTTVGLFSNVDKLIKDGPNSADVSPHKQEPRLPYRQVGAEKASFNTAVSTCQQTLVSFKKHETTGNHIGGEKCFCCRELTRRLKMTDFARHNIIEQYPTLDSKAKVARIFIRTSMETCACCFVIPYTSDVSSSKQSSDSRGLAICADCKRDQVWNHVEHRMSSKTSQLSCAQIIDLFLARQFTQDKLNKFSNENNDCAPCLEKVNKISNKSGEDANVHASTLRKRKRVCKTLCYLIISYYNQL